MKTAFIQMGHYGLKITLAALSLAGILYLLLFTSFGNSLAKPLLEEKLSTIFKTPIAIDALTLTPNRFELNFHDELNNTVEINGKLSLITLSIHALYQADLSQKGALNSFALPLKTMGTLKGGYLAIQIEGFTPVFNGVVKYHAKLNRFTLRDLHLSLNNFDYQSIMTWLEHPHHSSTYLNGELDLHGLDTREIKGNITLHTNTKSFFPSKIIDDNSSFDFFSLFADDQGKIQPFHLNLTLDASVDELGILEQFAMLPLRGNAHLSATLQGDQERLVLDAKSNIARSSTQTRVHWKKLRPSYVYADIKDADVPSLFSLFSKKSPTQGTLSLNVESTPTAIHYRGLFRSDLARTQIDNTTTHEEMLRDLLKAIP